MFYSKKREKKSKSSQRICIQFEDQEPYRNPSIAKKAKQSKAKFN